MGRIILGLALLIIPFTDFLQGQSPLTTVEDTLTSSSGPNPSGTITLTWGRYLDNSTPRKIIFPGSRTITVTNGHFLTTLFPNSVSLPPGGCISVSYHISSGGPPAGQTRYWYVPVSPTPVNLNTVESTLPCPTQSGILISPGQIAVGNATAGQALVFNGFYWAPGTVSGAGANPGGTNGQLQINSLGAFGGITIGGDCVLNNPNFICTKTNGIVFAPSATTDATNASNISSGLLANARGGTGTSSIFSLGSMIFSGAAGIYSQDNANLFWDFTNKRLGIGTNGPGYSIHVVTTTGGAYLNLDAHDGASQAGVQLTVAGAGKYLIGTQANADFFMYDIVRAHDFLNVAHGDGQLILQPVGGGVLIGDVNFDDTYTLDIQRSLVNGTMKIQDQTATTGATHVLIKSGAGQGASDLVDYQDNTGALVAGTTPGGETFVFDGGTFRAQLRSGVGFSVNNTGQYVFSSTGQSYGTADLGIGRNGSGILEVNNGTLGVFRDLKARNFTNTSLAGGGPQCVAVDNTGLLTVSGTGPCFPGSVFTPYSQTVSAQTAVTILAATHARGVTPFAICLDNASPKNVVNCAYTRNVSGDLVFAFNPAFSGTLEVRQ